MVVRVKPTYGYAYDYAYGYARYGMHINLDWAASCLSLILDLVLV